MRPLRTSAAPVAAGVDALIDEALLRALEPSLAALTRLLDSDRHAADEDGEPDGFDGIDRHGSISNLLATDWLLASEEPDEFLRRAEMRELSFLRQARRSEKRPQTSLVLFDAGPAQLGRPRLVHLACLVVLARRATASSTEMRWGTLHSDERFGIDRPDTLTRLIAARTLEPPRDDPPIDALVDDALVVSGHELGWPAQELVLKEADDFVAATLFDRRTGAVRRQDIPLPPAAASVRILRDPSDMAAPLGAGDPDPNTDAEKVDRRRPISNLVYDEQGNKLLARSGDGRSVAVFPAPRSDQGHPGKVYFARTASHLRPVLAAGRVGKSTVTVTLTDERDHLLVMVTGGKRHKLGGRYSLVTSDEVSPDDLEGLPLGSLTLNVLDGLQIRIGDIHIGQDLEEDFFATRVPRSFELSSLLSMTEHGDHWIIENQNGWSWTLQEPRDREVIGLAWSHEALVLLLDRTRGRVVALREHGKETLICESDVEILDAVTHPHAPTVALRLASGAIVVHHRSDGRELYRFDP